MSVLVTCHTAVVLKRHHWGVMDRMKRNQQGMVTPEVRELFWSCWGGSDPEIWRELESQALVESYRPTGWKPGDIYLGFHPLQVSDLLPGPNSSSQIDPVYRDQPSRVQSGVGKGEEQLWWGGTQRLPSTFLESFSYNFRGSLISRNQSANSPRL